MGAELFHADGQAERQTDMSNLVVVFRHFANALKMILKEAGCENLDWTVDSVKKLNVFKCEIQSAGTI